MGKDSDKSRAIKSVRERAIASGCAFKGRIPEPHQNHSTVLAYCQHVFTKFGWKGLFWAEYANSACEAAEERGIDRGCMMFGLSLAPPAINSCA
jgi:hypothetical protein